MIDYLSQVDPATWATVAAGLGTAVAGLGGKYFGHRSAVRKLEADTTERIAGAYGELLTDVQAQLRESRAAGSELHAKVEQLEESQRSERIERHTLTNRFEVLLEHVRVLRTILRTNRIDHPPGPGFLDDGGVSE